MTIDRARVRSAFLAYTAGYNAQDPKVALKLAHTWRVAALCERIARSLAMPAQDVDLAWLSGVLHDVGRFEQLRRYGTFNDAVSIDHALCSTQVLFEQGHIRNYLSRPEDLDDPALETLRTAVLRHSAYRLPDGLDSRTVLFCHILRDADKVDILRVNAEVPLEDIYNVSTRALRQSALTPAVVQAFYEHHCVLRSLKQTPADNVAGHASLVYELVFPESLRIAAGQGWLWKLLDFSSDNPDTAAALAEMKAHLRRWMDAALQSCENAL